jgi:alkylation response protein AidB-like acyl-CoA dehydrogenase
MRTPEQQSLADAVRSLLAKHADSPDLWSKLCDQIGVAGLDIADTAPVLEELGYALASVPLLASLVANEALRGTDAPDLQDRIAGGEVATFADKDPVLYGAQATILLAVTDEGLVLVESADVQPAPALDQSLELAHIDLGNATTKLIDPDGAAAAARARTAGLIGVSALAVGTAQRGLDMTVAYSKEREQFGRQIGSFQALKHRMADMLVLVEMSRSAAWAAASGELNPATAAAYCVDAVHKVAAETIQLHGGIAITWEHDAHRVFKRAHALGQLFGQPHELRADTL